MIVGIAQNGPAHVSPVQAWLKSPRTVTAGGVDVVLRRDAGGQVAEGEIAVVIGRPTRGLTAQTAQATGSGFVGQGVSVTGVKRLYDQFLTSQVLQQQGQASYLTSYKTSMSQVDSLLSNTTSGVSTSFHSFGMMS